MFELKHWRKVKLQQTMINSCIATSYEWLFKYNYDNFRFDLFRGFQEKYNLNKKNHFTTVRTKIIKDFTKKNEAISNFVNKLNTKTFETTINGFQERWNMISDFIKKDIPCVIPVKNDIGIHIMPVVRINDKEIWLLRSNDLEHQVIEVFDYFLLRRHFLNQEGGEDLAWLEKEKQNKETK